jgi:peptidoglycan hydrolase-like protein with peptidoglycan-binding domain
MQSDKFLNNNSEGTKASLESPFQNESYFSEEDTGHAFSEFESRMLGYGDESPFLQAFVYGEPQHDQPEREESDIYDSEQAQPERLTKWYKSEQPKAGDCHCKQAISSELTGYEMEEFQDEADATEYNQYEDNPLASEWDFETSDANEQYQYDSPDPEFDLDSDNKTVQTEQEAFEPYEPNIFRSTPVLNFVQPPPNSPYYVQEAFARWQEEISASNPNQVRWLQESLNKILGLRLKTDGIMGQQTRSAVITFQNRQGLKPDGIAGPKTEAAIKNVLLADISIPPRTEPAYTTPALLNPPGGQTSQRTIYGWSQYQRKVEELPADQQAALRDVGNTIIASYQPGGKPVKRVQVQGHADVDTPPNPQREQQYSQERAQMVTGWLKNYVGQYAAQITWESQGFGATRLKAQPTSEENRKRNRRVGIALLSQSMFGEVHMCPNPPTNSREFTKWLQRALNFCFGTKIPINGVFDATTKNAVKSFQSFKNLPHSGNLDFQTVNALQLAGAGIAPCSIGVQPKLCLYQVRKRRNDTDSKAFEACANNQAKRVCAFGFPVDASGGAVRCLFPNQYFKPEVGASPYETGEQIVASIDCAYTGLGHTPIDEIHIFGHSGPYGIYGSTYDLPYPHTGLYVDYGRLDVGEIRKGARLITNLPFDKLANGVQFFLHGCQTARNCTTADSASFGDQCEEKTTWGLGVSFAESLITHLGSNGKLSAKVFAHDGGDANNAGMIGVNAGWIEFYIDTGGGIKRRKVNRLPGPTHFCVK